MAIFQIRNVKMNYVFHNNGKNSTVLLGHSYLFDNEMWIPQVQALSQHYNIVIPDLWGHGGSDSIDTKKYSINDLAKDYAALMENLGISRYHVVGLSVGGMWGAHLALNHPDKVRSLVLMDTDLHEESPEAQEQYFGLLNKLESDGTILDSMATQITTFFHAPGADKRIVQYITSKISSLKDENIECIVGLGKIIFSRESILDRLHELKMPVMVAVGDQDGPRPPFESQRMHKHIEGSEYYEIPNAGHLSNIESPVHTDRMLVNFLAGVEAQESEHC
ncbi:MAG: alpha/beta hydrolase [Alphaproteobacteria bacterium]|nr:alpha/beta hydrolase [Alphaproteobacteria bacterium]